MARNLTFLALAIFLLANIYGCFAVVAGTAGGAGTSIWLAGKLTQEFSAPYERTIEASKSALRSLNLELNKETREENITQLRSKYTDGKEIWIDIRKIAKNSTKVEVRVGAVSPDKEACSKILKAIERYL